MDLPAPAFERGPGHAEPLGCDMHRQSGDALETLQRQPDAGAAQVPALRPGPLKARQNTFPNPFPLEFGDGGQDMHLELAGGRRGVDALRQTDERDAERLEFLEQRDLGA